MVTMLFPFLHRRPWFPFGCHRTPWYARRHGFAKILGTRAQFRRRWCL